MVLSPPPPILVWFRLDLRIADHPALAAAARTGRPVIPVFVWAPDEEAPWAPGAASRWWLHYSLAALDTELRAIGSRLVIRRGSTAAALHGLRRETGADTIFWSRRYEPAVRARDERIAAALKADGARTEIFNGALLFEPEALRTQSGAPYRVFTPFWRACLAASEPREPIPPPRRLPAPAAWPVSDPLVTLDLLPRVPWDSGLKVAWTPGERGAQRVMESFLEGALADYHQGRDCPGRPGTSRLSPHLHFGEVSPRQIWHAVRESEMLRTQRGTVRGAESYLREMGWREFAHHLLFYFPHTAERPLDARFDRFPWRTDPAGFRAWRRGHTGFPIVDAGMRELWHTGWMHNRARMMVASFLVKDLLVSWREGARWFWDTLVDADLANNTLGWQWTAGCGADAAPYFRIFNPVLQGAKYDPDGAYVRRWAPELAGVPAPFVHQPWRLPRPPADYPAPILDHGEARDRALAALSVTREEAGEPQ